MKAPTVRDLPTTTSRRGADVTAVWIVVLVVAALLGTWAGTQYVAHRLGYHDNLGPILYRSPSQLKGLISGAALACTAGAVALLTRAHLRRYSTLLALSATVLFVVWRGPIYSPFQFLRWARAYHGVPELAATITDAVRVAASAALVSMIAGVALVTSRRRRTVSRSHGSARWDQGESLLDSD